MREIVLFRIDERLIHGQVVTKWVGHTGADRILVIDDKLAEDSLMASVLKMAAPAGVAVDVLTKDSALRDLADSRDEKLIVIVGNPQTAQAIYESGLPILPAKVNMGNAGMAPGRSKLTPSVYLDEKGMQALRELHDQGRTVYFQTIPGETCYEWDKVIRQ